MNAPAFIEKSPRDESGLRALSGVANYFRVPADPARLRHDLALGDREPSDADLVRGALHLGLKARITRRMNVARLATVPAPALARLQHGTYAVFGGRLPSGDYRLVDPVTGLDRQMPAAELLQAIEGQLILLKRAVPESSADSSTAGFGWFLPSIWRYRRPLLHVLVASLFIQLFALVTPLFFQVIVDKVLVQKTYATLIVLVVGLAAVGLFDVVLQYLRTYALSHTTNRIDVELGERLFAHMLRLPLGYFETRAAGQTVARMRELETIRSFLTGQGLFSALDLLFAVVFVAVLFTYSVPLTVVVLLSLPLYVVIGAALRPALRQSIQERFNRSATNQQFLLEAVIGIGTIKAGAVEPAMRERWGETLAAYVGTAFKGTMQAAVGQNAIQFVGKLSTASILLFGAKAVIDGELTVGGLVAFNMIAGQVGQPVLRLSQLWQDYQQVQVSVERLGDILRTPAEPATRGAHTLPPPVGAIEFRDVTFRYGESGPAILKRISLAIRPGEVVGIVGSSGSGKSTLTKLVQRLYTPNEGRVLIDGSDISQIDPSWLRSHIGVVLQDNILFNRTIHDNIAFANVSMPRSHVIHMARLAGADAFIAALPHGYDTTVEERGANLSGGQRQRIAIARALATNPRILILDEATSALDYESESIIQRNMRSIVAGRTVIIIAHRLAAVRSCHRILTMQDGQIVETGSHDELVRSAGPYARLWAIQTSQMEAAA